MKPCLPNVGPNGHEEELELFRRALVEALENHWQEVLATGDPMPKEPSPHHKETMNRIFREEVGGSFQPYPEEK